MKIGLSSKEILGAGLAALFVAAVALSDINISVGQDGVLRVDVAFPVGFKKTESAPAASP